MIASPCRIQLGRPTKFAHHDHKSLVKHPALPEIDNQSVERLIERWNQADGSSRPCKAILESSNELIMSVPTFMVYRHERDAAFHQASRKQAALPHRLGTVSLPYRIGFPLNFKCSLSVAGSHQVISLPQVGIDTRVLRSID